MVLCVAPLLFLKPPGAESASQNGLCAGAQRPANASTFRCITRRVDRKCRTGTNHYDFRSVSLSQFPGESWTLRSRRAICLRDLGRSGYLAGQAVTHCMGPEPVLDRFRMLRRLSFLIR